MSEVYFTTQEHYSRIMELIDQDPAHIEIVTYSTGRTRSDKDVVWGALANDYNYVGLVLKEIQERLVANRIKKCTIVTTEPPQEVEAIEEFNRITWRQHNANHAKIWLFKFGQHIPSIAVLGSRNLTSTIFYEATVQLGGSYEYGDLMAIRQICEFVEAIIKQSVSLEGHQDWFGQVDQIDI